MSNGTASQVGHFLDYSYWRDAVKLLEFQIQRRSKGRSKDGNRHYNTLSMYYYGKLGKSRKEICSREYYDDRISNGLFYGLEKEFFVIPYVIPKSGFGLRNYKFLSYPMRVLYYAVGLYLLRLSEEFIAQYVKKQKRIVSRYGGNLYYKEGKLAISKKNTYYMTYYKQFRNQIRKEAETQEKRKVVIKLDIENYFDNISITLLNQLLDRGIKPSIKGQMNFDQSAIEQLRFFFSFIGAGEKGIPQFENDIVSGFLGYLYLSFADLHIENDLRKNGSNVVESHKILRYMDDTYISIVFRVDASERDMQDFLSGLFWRISDLLYYKLGLRLNPKTSLFWLRDEEQRNELLKLLRKVSPEYHTNENKDESIDNKMVNLFAEIKQLRELGINSFFRKSSDLQEEIMKEIYDERVEQILSKDDYCDKIDSHFCGFSFDLVKRFPQELVIILLKGKKTCSAFRDYLLNIPHVTISDTNLILKHLAQVSFDDSLLVKKLAQNVHMKRIVDVVQDNAMIDLNASGYYNVPAKGLCRLMRIPEAIDQIRLRRYNETVGSYSVALNHLVNELQAICRSLDVSGAAGRSSYDANAVLGFLKSCGVDHDARITVRNLFDKRNVSLISHPSLHGGPVYGIDKKEYEQFRDAVAASVSEVLSRHSGD